MPSSSRSSGCLDEDMCGISRFPASAELLWLAVHKPLESGVPLHAERCGECGFLCGVDLWDCACVNLCGGIHRGLGCGGFHYRLTWRHMADANEPIEGPVARHGARDFWSNLRADLADSERREQCLQLCCCLCIFRL